MPEQFDTIHARHFPVDDQHAVVLVAGQLGEGSGAAGDGPALDAEHLQHVQEDFAGTAAVIDDEGAQVVGQADALRHHGCPAARPKGRWKVKRLPIPGWLLTLMLPPCRSTMRLQMDKPRPVPPYLRVVEVSAW
jgi:hypothetical protein